MLFCYQFRRMTRIEAQGLCGFAADNGFFSWGKDMLVRLLKKEFGESWDEEFGEMLYLMILKVLECDLDRVILVVASIVGDKTDSTASVALG